MPSYVIERVGDLEQERASGYDIALANDETLVAVQRTDTGYLKFAQFALAADGGISKTGEERTVQADHVNVTCPTSTHWVTAAQKTTGAKLLVSSWSPVANHREDAEGVSSEMCSIDGFSRLVTLIGPPQDLPPGTLASHPKGYLVATAQFNSVHQLRVTAWLSGANDLSDIAFAVSSVKAVRVAIVAHRLEPRGTAETATFITASVTRNTGKLRLATWRLNVAPHQQHTLELVSETATEEVISEVSATTFSRSTGSYLATAVVTSAGNLKVLTWKIENDGTFTHWQDVEAGAAFGIDCVQVRRSDLAVGCRDGSNKLKVIYWRFPYATTGSQEVIRLGAASAGALNPAFDVKLAHITGTAESPGDTIVACRTTSKLKLIRFRLTAVE